MVGMGLKRAIEHGKERRRPYRGAKAYDTRCRNQGGCYWCRHARLYRARREQQRVEDALREDPS